MQSTRQLREELAWLSTQLEAARDLEHAAEERHSDEDMAETEAAHLSGAERKCSASEKGAPAPQGARPAGCCRERLGARA